MTLYGVGIGSIFLFQICWGPLNTVRSHMDIFPGGGQGSVIEFTTDKSSRLVLQINTRLLRIFNAPCGKLINYDEESPAVSLAGLLRICKGGGRVVGRSQIEASVSLDAINPSKWRPVRSIAPPSVHRDFYHDDERKVEFSTAILYPSLTKTHLYIS
jgi:hypothetical protein